MNLLICRMERTLIYISCKHLFFLALLNLLGNLDLSVRSWRKGEMKSLKIPQTTLFLLEILSSLLLHFPLFKEFFRLWKWWLDFVCKLESEEEIVILRFCYWPLFSTQKMQMFTIYLLHVHLIIEAHCRGIYIYLFSESWLLSQYVSYTANFGSSNKRVTLWLL